MPLYHHKAKITFRGQFPIDMLRYDRACPESEQDSAVIEQSGLVLPGPQTVEICKVTSQKKPQWTEGRWKSFGAKIEPLDTRRS